MSDLDLSARARELLVAARRVIGDAEAYLVGGSVRDALLGLDITDLDLAIAGDAPEAARALADALGGHYVLLDAERGTARIVLDEGDVRVIDIARLRDTIDDDLAARDFTIDALAVPIDGGDVIDLHGGLDDLTARRVRLVSEQALIDDPLRLLRAVRIATQLGFAIEDGTAGAIRRHAALIAQTSPERQRDEIARCFSTREAAIAVRLMDGLGLLDALLPEVTVGRGVSQPEEHHYYDVFDHAIETVASLDYLLAPEAPSDARERALYDSLWSGLSLLPGLRAQLDEELSEGRSRAALLKFAGLLHDVAKPETRKPDDTGRIRFFGHAERGAETARRIMQRFRFSRRETEFVALLVEEHLRPTQLSNEGLPSRRALFRYFRDTGDAAESVLLLSLADALAARGPRIEIEAWRGHVAYVAHVLERRHEDETIARPPRLITGDDLIAALGMPQGPELGRLLSAIEEAVGAGEVTTRDQALELARRLREGRTEAHMRASVTHKAAQTLVASGGAR